MGTLPRPQDHPTWWSYPAARLRHTLTGGRLLATAALCAGLLALIAPGVSTGIASGATSRARSGSSQVFVNCESFERGRFVYHARIRPSSCTLQGLPNTGAKEWKLSSLRWSGWGTTIAVATGLYHYRHGEYKEGKLVYPEVSTRIVLSRIRTGCEGRRFYTSAGDGEQTNRLAAGCTAEQ
jgi:hypothetical protein